MSKKRIAKKESLFEFVGHGHIAKEEYSIRKGDKMAKKPVKKPKPKKVKK
jgi:hypothetical protein